MLELIVSVIIVKVKENFWIEKFGGIKMRVNITLACTETGDRNYITKKNNRNNQERIELMKYSPRLRKHTLHRETK